MDESQISAWLRRSRLSRLPAIRFEVPGADPALPSRYRVGEAAAVALGLSAAAAADIHQTRGGPAQQVSSEVRAAALAITSYQHNRLDGKPVPRQPPGVPTSSIYQCGSGGWVHLQGGLPHLRQGTLDLLGCADHLSAIAETLRHWDAGELEEALAARGCELVELGAAIVGMPRQSARPGPGGRSAASGSWTSPGSWPGRCPARPSLRMAPTSCTFRPRRGRTSGTA